MDDSLISVGEGNSGSQKRQRKPTKRERERRKRYKKPNFGASVIKKCNHKAKRTTYECSKVTAAEIEHCRNRIYAECEKIAQDIQICHHMIPVAPKRRRPKKPNPTKEHNVSVDYIIPNPFGHGFKKVCQGFFLSVTKLSKSRLIKVAKCLKRGGVPKELRGGDQVSHNLQSSKEEVRTFLKGLRGQKSHYGRMKSKRIYLNSNLSISKLYREYKSSPQETKRPKVSMSTFHRIFSTEFNIGFKSPATDVCGMCERLKNSIRRASDSSKKSKLIMEKRIHNLKAKAFYELMKDSPPFSKTYCFDMQQVQPLPKSAVGEAFYLRQIGYYTFCIIENNGTNPVFYTWTEDQAGRGCTEIGSAILHFLENVEIEEDIVELHLFCDGCGGQNKNAHIIHTLLFWLQQATKNIKSITLIFPVRGHSFLPVDRVFGRAEKMLRKEASIKNKDQYHALYKEIGKVRVLGVDWMLYKIKGLEEIYRKLPGISAMKKIHLKLMTEKNNTVVKCRGLVNYRFESPTDIFQNLGKRGRSSKNYELQQLPLVRHLPPEKVTNVESLLKAEFNNDWRADPELAWYKIIIDGNLLENATQMVEEDNTEDVEQERDCDCLCEDDPALHL